MNFVFISPHFPKTYWNFCDRLKRRGVNVLGIGDTPYDSLDNDVKNSLNDYFYVTNLADYDQMYRACAYFCFKYGKIDWLESNNEFWLLQDAKLRSDFNIKTGPDNSNIDNIKYKSVMKQSYIKAGVPVARFHMVDQDIQNCRNFIESIGGYPVIAKPDNGCGAEATYKLKCEEDLVKFYETKPDVQYIMEEFINGTIVSFDGICDSNSVPIFYTSNYFPTNILDIVSSNGHLTYWTVKEVPEDLKDAGFRTIKAFGVKNRFFHCEFFRLNQDQQGLGKKDDIVALEVNMRPAGGYTPDMINFANSVDVYDLWADIITKDTCDVNDNQKHYYCVYASQRDGHNYKHYENDIVNKYGDLILMNERMPEALAMDMGNQMFTAKFETYEEMIDFIKYVQEEEYYEV